MTDIAVPAHPVWLGGLLFPGGFISATRQQAAHDLHVALDELRLDVTVRSRGLESDEWLLQAGARAGAVLAVSDLKMESAAWGEDSQCLQFSTDIRTNVDALLMRWVVSAPDSSEGVEHEVMLPMYQHTDRRVLLARVRLACPPKIEHSTWLLRGAALVAWASGTE